MTLRRLMLHSMLRFWKANLGVALGLAVAATVITGALIVGDSMRYSLKQIAEQRLGDVEYAIVGGDRFFTDDFALAEAPYSSGAVFLEGVVSSPDGRSRANQVAVNGVFGGSAEMIGLPDTPEPGKAFLNEALAKQLGAKPGDSLILRVPEPSALPIDAALVNASKPSLAIRFEVDRVVAADEGGRFSLRAEQQAPMSLFVNQLWLSEQVGLPGRVNAALYVRQPELMKPTLDDLELEHSPSPGGIIDLLSPRVFLDAPIETGLEPLADQRLLTYLVNTIALDDKHSPYAMVTAADQLGGLELADDEIAINAWLADDLEASVGDTLTLTYYLPDEGDRLTEASAAFTVARIVPIQGAFADRKLTPDFPGLAEADTLRQWDAGPAIDRSRIRDKDEAYWDQYRATPKAFISLDAGQRLWSNRFGTLTAVRFAEPVTEDQLLDRIDPAQLGLAVTDLRARAQQAAVGTVDFGQLFLSLSGFIIIAAILLAATLFVMSAEQRARQLGLMLAIGLTRRQVTLLIVGEALIVALFGGLLGMLGGVAYAYAVLGALSGVWSGAIADAAVQPHLTITSLLIGPVGAAVVGVLAIAWSLRALSGRPARALLSGAVGKVSGRPRLAAWVWAGIAVVLIAAGLGIAAVASGSASGMIGALTGFGAGASVLGGLFSALTMALVLPSLGRSRANASPVSAGRLSARNLTRRRGRTLAAACTLSCGVFMVIAVAGFRLGGVEDTTDRALGTGGFSLIVESSQPIRYDLNTELGQDHYAFGEDELPPGSVVPFRVSQGDDASCLNLNQTPSPRLLGVDPDKLEKRFSFMQALGHGNGWSLLNDTTTNPDAIPAIADANTAQWALKLAVGDTMTLLDERGQPFTIQLVATVENTILQGSLIINEDHFKQLFPSTSGHRMLLVDAADVAQRDERAELLADVLIDEGVSITPTADRLAAYNTVQNTYLSIFQSLGGLGVVLGAMGLGVIAARDLIERRSELALMYALGLTRSQLRRIVLVEKGLILFAGLLFGVLSAAVATLHTGQPLGGAMASSAVTVLATLAAGLLAVLLGLRAAGLSRLPQALRND